MSTASKIDCPKRTLLPHAIPPWVESGAVFFITICCAERSANSLCRPEIAQTIFESIQFRQQRGDWFAHLVLLMPDHGHALILFPGDRAMKRTVSTWKEIVAKKTAVRWQRDFFDHRLRNGESFDEKAHYIRMNPVRKALVTRPEDWPYVWEPPL
jgi:putative transposase